MADDAAGLNHWILAGDHACVLVEGGRVSIVVYWQAGDAGGTSAFYWFAADRADNHFFLHEAERADENGWATARELAEREHHDPRATGDDVVDEKQGGE